ncbi:MAG: metallophosphoesterase [Nostocaceae cyanobacterium]|nr:metallophosphoesterase [Nostocaceae cyanobacterium]
MFRFVGIFFVLSFYVFLYAYLIEPNWIEIKSLRLNLPHLASEFDGYRIAQISDIHTDKWTKQRRLKRIVRLINQQHPDLVVITGDLVTRRSQQFLTKLQPALTQLTPKDKTVAVLGNHDYENNPQVIIKALQARGIITLRNHIYTLKRGNAMLHIAGVDDVNARRNRLDLILKQLTGEDCAILLAHEPDFADISAGTKRFDLQLSGHSHAGQIRLPFLKPPILPPNGRKYYSGLYNLGEMLLYTNRGIGMTGLHFRFACRPEITVFTLVAKSK